MKQALPPETDLAQDEAPRTNDLIRGKHWRLTNIGDVTSGLVVMKAGVWMVQFNHRGILKEMNMDDFLNNAKSQDATWHRLAGGE